MYARRPPGCVWDSQFLIPKSKRVAFYAEVLQATASWRVVGVGVGLLHHDGEVEGVVVKDDAVRGRACYAKAHVLKRRSDHCVPSVL